MLDPEGEEEAP